LWQSEQQTDSFTAKLSVIVSNRVHN
jgi:hypothetical protein